MIKMINTASRLDNLKIHYFARIGGRITSMQAEGQDVIRLDEGAPDLPPPDFIINKLASAAQDPSRHSYQPHRGTPGLRSAWAAMYDRLYHVKLDPETEILPLLGSKEGIFHLPFAFINPGEIVLIPDPGYITYTRGTLMAQGIPYYMPLLQKNRYLPDFNRVPETILREAKIIWLNYPNNPTAAMAPLSFFEEVVSLAHQYGWLICHDAAYMQVTFQGKNAPSILQVPGAKEVALEFNTLSKSHNMAGWRVAAVVGNIEFIKPLYALKTNLDSGHFLPILEAAETAMMGDQTWIKNRNEIYRERRDIFIKKLHEVGLAVEIPEGSLYIWCPVLPGWKSEDFCTKLLDEAQVSLTPGTVFGPHGEGFMRISLTAPKERIQEAANRIAQVVLSLRERISG
jgi:LL-diaminopimelate aminotransferase